MTASSNVIERDAGYGIEPFGPGDWPTALAQLLKGYPGSAQSWWQAGFERMRRVPGNRADHPIGLLLHGPDGLVGVALLFGSGRPAHGDAAGPLWINLSSWAILPQARDRALWFARRGLSEPGAVYTSLTPIAATAGILRRLGFEPVSQQLVLGVTPKLARGGSHVLGGAQALVALRDHAMAPILEDHHRLGCLVCAVEGRAGWLPVVLRRRYRSVFPVAEVIYTPSTAGIAREIGSLARFLLLRGYPMVEFEADAYMPIEFAATRLFRLRMARGPYPRQGIDHLYSELVYLHR